MSSRAPRRALPAVALAAVVALILGQLVSLWLFSIPYYRISPGPTAAVEQLISVPAAHRHAARGQVLLTTVLQAPAHITDFLLSWARHDDQLVSSQDIAGNLTPDQLQKLDQAQMTASQQYAEVVALRRAGYTVIEHGTGAVVVAVVPHTPASGILHPGDVIVSIDGRPTPLVQNMTSILAAARPGQRVTLVVRSTSSAMRTVTVALTRRPDNASEGFLGVEPVTNDDRFSFPFTVTINSDGIGGPSAGLAFALGILQELTGADLTKGGRIAATGTIDPDGRVGDVGGVAQKTVSVTNAGATLFLVPPGEYAAAVAHAGPHLKVVKVATFEQALAAIARNGGSLVGLPPAPSDVK